MSENSPLLKSSTSGDRTYKITPFDFRKIKKHLEEYPERFNDEREFVRRAIELFLKWETDTLEAEKMMHEMDLTIAQLSLMHLRMPPDYMEKNFPGQVSKNKKEIDQFLQKHPEYAAVTKAPSAEEAQAQERASKGDLIKLRADVDDIKNFIREQEFKNIQREDDMEEIFYDEWPVLWTHYTRILPAKIAIMAIANIMNTNKEPVIKLDEGNAAKIYDIAEELSEELREYEERDKIGRARKLSTGLPKPFKGNSITPSQALAMKRYKDRVIGKERRPTGKENAVFDGLLSALGLVRTFVRKKDIFLTFTENGKKFCLLENKIMDNGPDNFAFSPKERKTLLGEILPQRELEMELIRSAAKTIHNTDPKFITKMSDNLDDNMLAAVKDFVDREPNKEFAKKIQEDIINQTEKIRKKNETADKKDQQQTPIEAHRIATMGRLSEIGLITWDIKADDKGHAYSNYTTNDKEMMLELL